LALATHGVADATAADPDLAKGVNTVSGSVTNAAVAEALGRPAAPLAATLAE
jgi:alanine dehydrogenase